MKKSKGDLMEVLLNPEVFVNSKNAEVARWLTENPNPYADARSYSTASTIRTHELFDPNASNGNGNVRNKQKSTEDGKQYATRAEKYRTSNEQKIASPC